MNGEAETLGVIAGAADDHPTNPAFYVHCNDILASIDKASSALARPGHQALRDTFLFLYFLILDLDRKFMYLHKATKPYFDALDLASMNEDYPELLDLLKTVARHHEQIEGSKPALDRMVETLEQITHELWAGHKDNWHEKMGALTGIPLTLPMDASRIEDVLETRRRYFLESTPRRRGSDPMSEDHHLDRKNAGRAALPRRETDDVSEDFSENGARLLPTGR